MSIDYTRLFHQLILAFSKVLDMDESRKLAHAQRTAVLGHLLASNLCPQKQSLIYYAALLHDIGGIGLFDHIVHCPDPWAQAANPAIRVHPVVGAQIVNSIPGLEPCMAVILDHHERYDSHGYPKGKNPQYIPQGAQIVRGADAFDLLLHNTQNPKTEKLAAAFAQKSGRETSPEIVDLICQFIADTNTLKLLTDDKAIWHKCVELNRILPGFTPPWGVDVIGSLLETFAQIIDTKHTYTVGHSQRVSKYGIQIGLTMELPHDEISTLRWAALVHDLGKVAIPRRILDSQSPLSGEEFEIVKQHPQITIEVLSCISELEELGRIGAYHHERWDGKGYPDGLKGEDIPLLSRIICIADAFDSLTSGRPYRKTLGSKNAIEQLSKECGTHFDPHIFEIAKTILWSGVK